MDRKEKTTRQYLIGIQSWRSKIALFACVVTFIITVGALVEATVENVLVGNSMWYDFAYFTNVSNWYT